MIVIVTIFVVNKVISLSFYLSHWLPGKKVHCAFAKTKAGVAHAMS